MDPKRRVGCETFLHSVCSTSRRSSIKGLLSVPVELSKNSKEKERDSISGLAGLVSMADNSDGIGDDVESLSLSLMVMVGLSGSSVESGSMDSKRAVSDLWNSSSEWMVVFCVESET